MNRTACTAPRRLSSRIAAAGLAAAAFAGVTLMSSTASASPSGFVAPSDNDDPQTIVGGDLNAGDPSIPLLVVYGEGGQQSICTGSLVSAQWILTAAHCVDSASLGFEPAQIEVYFGTQYSEQDPGYLGSVYADSYTMHDRWDTNNLEAGHDIAVVHLTEGVDLPLIPVLGRPLQYEEVGSPVRLIGWGLTYGDRQDSGVKRHVMSTMFDFNDLLVQVGDQTANTCSGDSGGPALMNIGGQEVQIGVTSYGDTGCAQYGVDTRVDVFANWITEATGGEVVPSAGGAGGGQPTDPNQPTQPGGQQPGAAGCDTHEDCGGGLCVSDGAQSMCTTTCSSSDECGSGMDCFATDDDPNVGVCWPSDDPGGDDDDDGQTGIDKGVGGGGAGAGGGDRYDEDEDAMGCSVAPNRSAPASLLALVALGLVTFRRRRQ